jgi:hypothetical protein
MMRMKMKRIQNQKMNLVAAMIILDPQRNTQQPQQLINLTAKSERVSSSAATSSRNPMAFLRRIPMPQPNPAEADLAQPKQKQRRIPPLLIDIDRRQS